MNKLELIDQIKDLLNIDTSQTRQDFTDAQLDRVLNRVYIKEVNKAVQHGSRRWFMKAQSVTWPQSQLQLKLPKDLRNRALVRFQDITDDSIGVKLQVSEVGSSTTLWWYDNETLQWGNSGPGRATTLKLIYIAKPINMENDEDEPDLIPEPHQELLIWSTACELRIMADEEAPASWQRERQEQRFDFWKTVARGRPFDDTPWITPNDGELFDDHQL